VIAVDFGLRTYAEFVESTTRTRQPFSSIGLPNPSMQPMSCASLRTRLMATVRERNKNEKK